MKETFDDGTDATPDDEARGHGALPVTARGTSAVTWAGHAGWIVRVGGSRVLAH